MHVSQSKSSPATGRELVSSYEQYMDVEGERRMTIIMKELYERQRTTNLLLVIAIFLAFLIASGGTAAAAGMMLLSDTDSSLAVKGAADGTLTLASGCTPSNTDCTWTYTNGMLLSDTNPSLAINAYGGADTGSGQLKLVSNCAANNTDCT